MWLHHLAGAGLAILFLVAIRMAGLRLRTAAAVGLVAAALAYVGAALLAGDRAALGLELAGLALFGALGWAGLRDGRWLVVGWLVHPLWDAAFHLLGTGGAPGMTGYAHVCLAFDPVVAGYLAWAGQRATRA